MKIGIINYGLGNVGSVLSAFKFYRYNVALITNPKGIETIDVVILTGIGNFNASVSRLKEFHLWDKLNEEILIKKKPVIGICLGMQLFADVSHENAINNGFGWIKGKVIRINSSSIKVPHIGWNEAMPKNSKMFRGLQDNFFYFMHSYHFVPEDGDVIAATTKYGDVEIVSAVRRDNIVGVQFHPEKSQNNGLKFLRNCLEVII